MQPVFERPFVTLLVLRSAGTGCFRGLPLGLLTFGEVQVWASRSVIVGASLKSSRQKVSSSIGSGLGAVRTPSVPCSQPISFVPSSALKSSESPKSMFHDVHDDDEAECSMAGAVANAEQLPMLLLLSRPASASMAMLMLVLIGDRWPGGVECAPVDEDKVATADWAEPKEKALSIHLCGCSRTKG